MLRECLDDHPLGADGLVLAEEMRGDLGAVNQEGQCWTLAATRTSRGRWSRN